jgi:hypothetical protein
MQKGRCAETRWRVPLLEGTLPCAVYCEQGCRKGSRKKGRSVCAYDPVHSSPLRSSSLLRLRSWNACDALAMSPLRYLSVRYLGTGTGTGTGGMQMLMQMLMLVKCSCPGEVDEG